MKIAIKTAHGYLSFQPPRNGVVPPLEYRAQRGAWEEIEFEGLAEALAVEIGRAPAEGQTPDHGETPAPVYPFLITPSASGSYVAAIKAHLLARGTDLSGPCGAFQITKTVAYGLSLMNPAYGLLSKTSGNNCQGYATDVVMRDNGEGFDILGDGGNANNPQWTSTGVDDGKNRFRPALQVL